MMSSSLKRCVISSIGSIWSEHTVLSSMGGLAVDQAGGDGDAAIPEALEVQLDLRAVHADVGDRAARRDAFLAQHEHGRNADASVAVSTPHFQVLAYNLKRVINILGIARTMKAVRSMGA